MGKKHLPLKTEEKRSGTPGLQCFPFLRVEGALARTPSGWGWRGARSPVLRELSWLSKPTGALPMGSL